MIRPGDFVSRKPNLGWGIGTVLNVMRKRAVVEWDDGSVRSTEFSRLVIQTPTIAPGSMASDDRGDDGDFDDRG